MVDLRETRPFEAGHNHEVPEEVFAEIGRRLILLQDLEMFIAFAAKVVFPEDAAKARDAILNSDRKTLGQLLRLLRERVEIEKTFDERLKRTLRARNLFIHKFSHEFDLRTKTGLRRGVRFLLDTMDDMEEVTRVMKALVLSFGRDKSVSDSELEEDWRRR